MDNQKERTHINDVFIALIKAIHDCNDLAAEQVFTEAFYANTEMILKCFAYAELIKKKYEDVLKSQNEIAGKYNKSCNKVEALLYEKARLKELFEKKEFMIKDYQNIFSKNYKELEETKETLQKTTAHCNKKDVFIDKLNEKIRQLERSNKNLISRNSVLEKECFSRHNKIEYHKGFIKDLNDIPTSSDKFFLVSEKNDIDTLKLNSINPDEVSID